MNRTSELQPGCELKRTRSSGAEHLARARARLSIIHLIEHIAIACEVGNVEDVKDFSNERQRGIVTDAQRPLQTQVLRNEAVSVIELFRQNYERSWS